MSVCQCVSVSVCQRVSVSVCPCVRVHQSLPTSHPPQNASSCLPPKPDVQLKQSSAVSAPVVVQSLSSQAARALVEPLSEGLEHQQLLKSAPSVILDERLLQGALRLNRVADFFSY